MRTYHSLRYKSHIDRGRFRNRPRHDSENKHDDYLYLPELSMVYSSNTGYSDRRNPTGSEHTTWKQLRTIPKPPKPR